MKAVEGSSGVCNIIHPLTIQTLTVADSKRKGWRPYLLWFRNHHMTIHENPWYTLRNTREDGGT
jgi:hypothetical protein